MMVAAVRSRLPSWAGFGNIHYNELQFDITDLNKVIEILANGLLCNNGTANPDCRQAGPFPKKTRKN
jgi:hypothetical protein